MEGGRLKGGRERFYCIFVFLAVVYSWHKKLRWILNMPYYRRQKEIAKKLLLSWFYVDAFPQMLFLKAFKQTFAIPYK